MERGPGQIGVRRSGTRGPTGRLVHAVGMVVGLVAGGLAATHSGRCQSMVDTIAQVQAKMVKIYGAGGLRGLEPFQSGFLISPDGHVLTVFSHVLDTDEIAVVLADGRRSVAQLVGADPRLEAAVLKIDGSGLPAFELDEAVDVPAGTRVLAFSNLFGVATGNEPVSVQHGVISVQTRLEARRGVFETTYRGPVYVLDAVTNNPGAAGGAVVTYGGQLVGMLGKELRNARNNTWLNYALPGRALAPSVKALLAGQPTAQAAPEEPAKPPRSLTLDDLGLLLVPNVVPRTPPYVDHVRPGSPAALAGLEPDDLIVLLNDRLIQTCTQLLEELEFVDYEDPVSLTVLRGHQLLEFTLQKRR
ncbi:MAG TPA: serine protease [Planctomycetaceae bacterium]|nr:serine protease [Planctomycetaceae bacterium]